jgi:hypothetical protein
MILNARDNEKVVFHLELPVNYRRASPQGIYLPREMYLSGAPAAIIHDALIEALRQYPVHLVDPSQDSELE